MVFGRQYSSSSSRPTSRNDDSSNDEEGNDGCGDDDDGGGNNNNITNGIIIDIPQDFEHTFNQDDDAFFKNDDMRQLDIDIGDLDGVSLCERKKYLKVAFHDEGSISSNVCTA